MSTLERAIAIAESAHAGKTDKAGAPYIGHPLRVMEGVSSPEERIAAVLHDVVEDSKGVWSLERLRREGFSETIVTAVDALTRREDEGEDYMDYVRRAKKNPIARAVKLADLHDNMDMTRIAHPSEKDLERRKKYERAEAELLSS